MINDLRLGIKSLRYSHGWKKTGICAALLMVPGVALVLMGPELDLGFYSGFILVIEAIYPMQLLYSLSVSNMLQVSPVKKKMQTTVPALLCTFCMAVIFLFTLLLFGIRIAWNPSGIYNLCGELVQYAVWMVCVMVYMAVAYKYFVLSTCGFLVLNVVLVPGARIPEAFVDFSVLEGVGAPFLAAALGLGLIAAGGLLEYLLSLLVYRAPMSKLAQTPSLRREL